MRTTATALAAVGYRVDLVPDEDNSAAGMAAQMIDLEPEPRRILTLRSEIAKPVLTRRLTEAGHDVRSVVAYRTVGVPVTERIAHDVEAGAHQRDPRHEWISRRAGAAPVPRDSGIHRRRGDRTAGRRRTPAQGRTRCERGGPRADRRGTDRRGAELPSAPRDDEFAV